MNSHTNPHLSALRRRLAAPDAQNEVYWAKRSVDRLYLSLEAWGRPIPEMLIHARKVLDRLSKGER